MICSLTDNLPLKKQNAVLYKKNVCDGTIMNGSREGVFHIDGTYKLVRNGFPVVVFGVSDIQGSFHPIAFCSHPNLTIYMSMFSSNG